MSRIFSEVVFEPRSSGDHRLLAGLFGNVDVQHKALWRLFDLPAGAPRPFLYHLRVDDRARDPGRVAFWMLSDTPPKATDGRWRVRHKTYAPAFRVGQRLSFELRVAPSVSRVDPRRAPRAGRKVPRSSRFDPVAAAISAQPPGPSRAEERQRWMNYKLAEWLHDKAGRCGFTWSEPGKFSVVRYEQISEARGGNDELTFSIADFRGKLIVTDAAAFTQAAIHGIGHQRAFGCGMLLLRPAVSAHDDDAEDD